MTTQTKGLRFDWYPKIPTEIFERSILSISREIDQTRQAKAQVATKAKEKNSIEQLLIALYQAYYIFPIGSGRVSVPMTSGHYSASSNDPGKVAGYSYRTVKLVIVALESKGWIEKEKGVEVKGVTRIWASGFLIDTFKDIGLRWFPQIPNPLKDLVVLRNYKNPEGQTREEKGPKVNLLVPKSADVDRYRSSLYQYNHFLTQHCVALDLDDDHMDQLCQVWTSCAK